MDDKLTPTIIELIFTIFVFLLGLPALVFQIFIHEELRKLYNKYFKYSDIFLLIFFFVFLLFIFLYAVFHSTCVIKNINIIYIFIFFCISVVVTSTLKTFFFKDIRERLVKKIVAINIKSYNKNKYLTETDDLDFMGRQFEAGHRSGILIEGVSQIIKCILSQNNRDGFPTYKGEETKSLIKILFDTICHQDSAGDENNYREVIKIFELIAKKQKKELKMIDARELKICILPIGIKALERNWIQIAIRSIDLLQKLPDSKREVFYFAKSAYAKNEYQIVLSIIRNSISKLRHEKKELRLFNFIAILSWFFSGHNQLKKYAFEIFSDINKIIFISRHELLSASTYFYQIGDFDSAECIEYMSKNILPLTK